MSESKKTKYTTVSIPVTLYERLREIIKDTGFTSVSQFVTYILREVVATYESQEDDIDLPEESKKQILERLKRLGYL
ncbi:MAG: ribbon-helix-helix domain-containing protein [Desulfurococcales archaeon]|nr:ribbon-helix-helix domain-containing protein [Desulfurococcales archaeon]MEB3760841.1 ribbon-helix-helix domain-containing protein [Desulfurococcales archaeon]MEB3789116.1 ribbon-helix-helix domain-containing protein [Desulfurococcales archaeon]